MGQVAVNGTLVAGTSVCGCDCGFPSETVTAAFATTPNPKGYQVASGCLTRHLATALNVFVGLSGIGATDTVTAADFLWVRTDSPMQIRVSQKTDPSTTVVTVHQVTGLFVWEPPTSQPIVLLEASGSGTIEYFVSGQI